MKRSYRAVIALSMVLFLSIVCTQYTVNMYYYQQYEFTVLFALLNILLFPLAIVIYKKGVHTDER
jgi:hypothetical protein